MRKVASGKQAAVQKAMFARHPQMRSWPGDHDFFFAALDLTDIWLINFYGGAANISPAAYYAAKPLAVAKPAPPKRDCGMGPAFACCRLSTPHLLPRDAKIRTQ